MTLDVLRLPKDQIAARSYVLPEENSRAAIGCHTERLRSLGSAHPAAEGSRVARLWRWLR